MAYRFTDTEKWEDSWYISLSAHGMLMFNYLCDNCDIAGFYELSMKKIRSRIPISDDDIKIAFKEIELSYVFSRDKTIILLKNFVKHQKNLPLNHRNASHRGIFARIENYKKKFAFDIVKIINQGAKPKLDNGELKGLQSSLGIGNGSIYLFQDFWSLYDKKFGDKKLCERKWNSLKQSTQKKILESLPLWKSQFSEKQFQPYPETYLKQERWNDDLTPDPKKIEKPLTIAM